MTDTPKFEVIDRRKRKLEEESAVAPAVAAESAPIAPEPAASQPGPRLVVSEPDSAPAEAAEEAYAMPAAPTAEESAQQKAAYDASAEHLDTLIRAQNPGAGPQPPVTFDSLVQQLYLSTMVQMGAGTREGERPRVDIVGAKQTIDLLGIVAEKTKGNLTDAEDRLLQTVLFETRMAFLELTSMITLQPPQPPTAI